MPVGDAEEAESLNDELWIVGHDLFGYPENMSEEHREMHDRVMLREPRKPGTAWDGLPGIEAELLVDGGISCTLARGELSIFVGAIDMMLENLAPRRDEHGRVEVRLCVGAEIEEAGALKNELRGLERETQHQPSG